MPSVRFTQRSHWLSALAIMALVCACHRSPPAVRAAPKRADSAAGEWLTAGRDASGSYHSPLTDINTANVAQLGFAWAYDMHTRRGLEATPIMVDGTLYFSGNFGRVYAVDAASGVEKWVYDPQVDGQWGRYACCDAVNRGVAVSQGRVFVGALDGYLHAIDAATGRRVWKVDTLLERDPQHPYTLPGAPVVAGDSVVIGTAGAEFAGVRGSVAAFDRTDGRLKWRFYTVPKDPKSGSQDQPHLLQAVKTWDPQHPWERGTGGTVWDGISYDPELDLLYVGTANGAPYQIKQDDRSEGDELFTASILAIHQDTGKLAWWYQATPGNRWDYDSTQKMIFADLDFGHGPRKVLMQANKNGFFYVLDRGTGELVGAHSFAYQNWTLGLDPVTHRPRINPATGPAVQPRLIFPGPAGAHSWQPMSFDARSTLAFIPTIEQGMVWIDTTKRRAGYMEAFFNEPEFAPEDYHPETLEPLYGSLPTLASLTQGIPGSTHSRGVLRAVDPITGKTVWEQATASAWDGGVLSTDGNLVVQGDVNGLLKVYAADSGQRLATVELGTSIMAAPMSYKVNGTQYIAVLAGLGGANLAVPFPAGSAAAVYGNAGRLIVLKLGGGPVPRPALVTDQPVLEPPARSGTATQIAQGEVLYNRYCGRCHVFGQGVLPDLRRMSGTTDQHFYDIVLDGLYANSGMARWDDVLSKSDAESIHAYVNNQAWQLFAHR